jgi:hypothetical protein
MIEYSCTFTSDIEVPSSKRSRDQYTCRLSCMVDSLLRDDTECRVGINKIPSDIDKRVCYARLWWCIRTIRSRTHADMILAWRESLGRE